LRPCPAPTSQRSAFPIARKSALIDADADLRLNPQAKIRL
jgi:hypothetical protein